MNDGPNREALLADSDLRDHPAANAAPPLPRNREMLVERDLLDTCLELFEMSFLPCTDDCDCIIHTLRAVLGEPDGPADRRWS